MSQVTTERKLASVKWFNHKAGYGFLTDLDSGSDVFVHHNGIKTDDNVYKTLEITANVIKSGFTHHEARSKEESFDYEIISVLGVTMEPKKIDLHGNKIEFVYNAEEQRLQATLPTNLVKVYESFKMVITF